MSIRATEARAIIGPRADVDSVPLHDPVPAPGALDLSDNTNRWGAPPTAAAVLASFDASSFARYPSAYSGELTTAIASYVGVEPSMVVTGCGSDDVLDAAIRAFGGAASVLAHIEPTFGMIPAFARLNGLRPRATCLTTAYDADVTALLREAAIVYLCVPNNPTGTGLPRDTIERVVREARGLVIVDEAYAEFTRGSVVDLVRSSERLLVTRTFSKAFGLAGIRVGYGIASPSLVQRVKRSRGPYKVSTISEHAAVSALSFDRAWVDARVDDAIAMRGRLMTLLRGMSLEPLPSQANFLLVPVRDAARVAGHMRESGVVVRAFTGLPYLSQALLESRGDALRITVAPLPEIERAVAALRDARDACA
jgi:histidinol-phosphate aminotransferase